MRTCKKCGKELGKQDDLPVCEKCADTECPHGDVWKTCHKCLLEAPVYV